MLLRLFRSRRENIAESSLAAGSSSEAGDASDENASHVAAPASSKLLRSWGIVDSVGHEELLRVNNIKQVDCFKFLLKDGEKRIKNHESNQTMVVPSEM